MTELTRPDLSLIAEMVRPGARVLDIGCGKGELLQYLAETKQVDGRGLELSHEGVQACVTQGLSVIQGDADTDLTYYPDKGFEYAILSQTIQATRRPDQVLKEMLRIANYALVSIPNFGFWKSRAYLALKGRMPVTNSLSYQWYETPNIHFCTVHDFIDLCQQLNLKVLASRWVDSRGTARPFKGRSPYVNLMAEQGVFLLSK